MTTAAVQVLEIEELQKPLQEMKAFIESKQYTDWSSFNHAKKSFLDVFKSLDNRQEKQKIWKEFTDVADQARGIRKVQEEEGEFAAEMIAKALDALEVDLQQFIAQKAHHALFAKVASFKSVADELALNLNKLKFLSHKADQIQGLRDELSKTGMRLSIKGKLFDRLSKIGDRVFPDKKILSSQIVESFLKGLKIFCQSAEKTEDGQDVLFQIRVIQSFLREMSLKKSDYDNVKSALDPLWKKALILKDKQEATRVEQAEKSQVLHKSFDESFEQMNQLIGQNQDVEALKIYDGLIVKLKDRQILKSDFRQLKTQLESFAKPLFDRLKEQKNAKKQEIALRAVQQDEKKQNLFNQMVQATSVDEMKNYLNLAFSLNLNSEEEYRFKYTYLQALSADAKETTQLEDLYFEVKELQEKIRSELGSSGLDFAKSLAIQELYDDVKHLLNEIVKKLD